MIRFRDYIVDSGLLKKEPHIMLMGFVSDSILIELKTAFSKGDDRSKVFFASYSQMDIPIGTSFQKVFDLSTNQVENVECKLVEVTQQFGRPMELIPSGWKTICKIKFNTEVPLLIKGLPQINEWATPGSKSIVLTNNAFWNEYNRLVSFSK